MVLAMVVWQLYSPVAKRLTNLLSSVRPSAAPWMFVRDFSDVSLSCWVHREG